ncbi:secondary thiamine-phosphate synthase enzyme YjbQ [Minwuia sp.]|uniref:secondary thiamine-phosphate synthase enzyme YjbQ n=1 Tax=Minwuia sp. TaxID=2493630 RepID=UPI003A8E8A9E
MRQVTTELRVRTSGRGLYEVTDEITGWSGASDIATGLLTVFIRHTSASLLIQENADPDVLADLNSFFTQLVPDDPARYLHTAEGPDDMPAHIRSALTQTSLGIPVRDGRPVLGTWQGIYLFEHRTRPHDRKLALHLIGD